ncbi:MAG: hypothetical protein CVV16_00700 [Gammaproteobacteria bacterium HGW-Gammaproteobacteria-6]|nr:MAG: hypothetical protein CVV16_00700 [Gammaproteobacteria bacterium HGW-Gammaproteobacteria-6]
MNSDTMKLDYSISTEQLDTISQHAHARFNRQSQGQAQHMHRAVQLSLLIGLPALVFGGVLIFVLPRSAETLIAALLALPLAIVLVRFYLRRPLPALPDNLGETAIERTLWESIRQQQRTLAGHYHLQLGESSMNLSLPDGRCKIIPWGKISLITEDDCFYYLATPVQQIIDRCFLIAKQGDGVTEEYQAALNFMLTRLRQDGKAQ